jgi:tRNA (guanine-N7-)-methyltransferase
MANTSLPRRIRSYVRREGRITPSQQRALSELWPRYGIEPEQKLDLNTLFERQAHHMLEIGFGMGASLAELAKRHPEIDYLGIEVHRPGVGSLLMKIEQLGLKNVRIICTDAVDVMKQNIPDASLDGILLFFPDPWPKKRHHKRRIVTTEFVELVRQKLKIGGFFHMATDWEDYALYMMRVMSTHPGFSNNAGCNNFAPRPEDRPLTKFEQRGAALGHQVWDLIFTRNTS